jgi:hypothetical protein
MSIWYEDFSIFNANKSSLFDNEYDRFNAD